MLHYLQLFPPSGIACCFSCVAVQTWGPLLHASKFDFFPMDKPPITYEGLFATLEACRLIKAYAFMLVGFLSRVLKNAWVSTYGTWIMELHDGEASPIPEL